MTAANRNKQTSLAGINSPKDFFPTDERLCDAVVKALIREKLLDPNFGPALEPSCGPGNWIKSLRKNGYKQAIVGVEKFDEVAMRAEAAKELSAHLIVADFLEMTKETLLGVASNDDNEKEGFGLIIGNPPFTLTSAFTGRHV